MTIKCPNEFECQFFIFSERLCVRERESEERERESKFMGEGGRERVRAVRNIIERIWRLFRHSLFPLRNFFPFLQSEPPPPSPPRFEPDAILFHLLPQCSPLLLNRGSHARINTHSLSQAISLTQPLLSPLRLKSHTLSLSLSL